MTSTGVALDPETPTFLSHRPNSSPKDVEDAGIRPDAAVDDIYRPALVAQRADHALRGRRVEPLPDPAAVVGRRPLRCEVVPADRELMDYAVVLTMVTPEVARL